MVLATYSIVRATLNSEEVNQECVSRYLAFALHFISAVQLYMCFTTSIFQDIKNKFGTIIDDSFPGCRFMCEGGHEVARGGDGARLLVELG